MRTSVFAIGRRCFALALVVTLAWVGLVGCKASPGASVGQAQLKSVAEADEAITARFDRGVYRRDDENTALMVLWDGPSERPRAAMVVRLFWVPRAGATPLSVASTNATINYITFGDEDDQPVAVYSGAGFVSPRDRLGKASLRVYILDTNFRLRDASEGYVDPIGNGRLTGQFTIERHHDATDEAIDRLNRMVRERLGHPRLVHAD